MKNVAFTVKYSQPWFLASVRVLVRAKMNVEVRISFSLQDKKNTILYKPSLSIFFGLPSSEVRVWSLKAIWDPDEVSRYNGHRQLQIFQISMGRTKVPSKRRGASSRKSIQSEIDPVQQCRRLGLMGASCRNSQPLAKATLKLELLSHPCYNL